MSRRAPPFPRYFAFAALSIGVAVVGLWGFAFALAATSPDAPNPGGVMVFGLIMTVIVGWVIWGPILAAALMPGFFLFRWIHKTLCSVMDGHILPNLLAAAVVSVLSWLLPWVLLGWLRDTGGTLFGPSTLLLFGTPAALVSAFLILIRREET